MNRIRSNCKNGWKTWLRLISLFLLMSLAVSKRTAAGDIVNSLDQDRDTIRVIVYGGMFFPYIDYDQFHSRLAEHGLKNFLQPWGVRLGAGLDRLQNDDRLPLSMLGDFSYTTYGRPRDGNSAEFTLMQLMGRPGYCVWFTHFPVMFRGSLGLGGGKYEYGLFTKDFQGAESAAYLALEPEFDICLFMYYVTLTFYGSYNAVLFDFLERRYGDWKHDEFHHPYLNSMIGGANLQFQF